MLYIRSPLMRVILVIGALLLTLTCTVCSLLGRGWPSAIIRDDARLRVVPEHMQASGASATANLIIAASGQGHLEPCGCTQPQLGGIARRAAALRALRADNATPLFLSIGDLVRGIGRQDEMKFQILMEAMKAVGYVAHNVGLNDLILGVEMLRAFPSEAGYPKFISANVFDAKGQRLFEPWVSVPAEAQRSEVRGQRTEDRNQRREQTSAHGPQATAVVVIGVISDAFAEELKYVGEGLVVKKPAEVLTEILRTLSANGFNVQHSTLNSQRSTQSRQSAAADKDAKNDANGFNVQHSTLNAQRSTQSAEATPLTQSRQWVRGW